MAGSVFKRGEHYYIRYDLPPTEDGRRRQKMESCKGLNKKQSEAKLRQRLMEIDQGVFAEQGQTKLAAFMEDWLQRTKCSVRPMTHDGYQRIVRNQITPGLGAMHLSKIKPQHVQKFVDSLNLIHSPKTIRNVMSVLRSALDHAVQLRDISYNPCRNIILPMAQRPSVKALDVEGIARLMVPVEHSRYRVPILIALHTGMRRSEVLGLQWRDFDADHKTLTVQRSVTFLRQQMAIAEPKTRSSGRPVLISDELVDILKEHRKSQIRQGIGTPWICAKANGQVIHADAFKGAFQKITAKEKLDITLHGLRHTQATMLILAGVPVKVVSERLGHASSSITQDTYTHILPNMQESAVRAFSEIMEEAAKLKRQAENS